MPGLPAPGRERDDEVERDRRETLHLRYALRCRLAKAKNDVRSAAKQQRDPLRSIVGEADAVGYANPPTIPTISRRKSRQLPCHTVERIEQFLTSGVDQIVRLQ